MSFKRIVVTTDFSDPSRKTFPVAASLARRFSAQLSVLYLSELPLTPSEILINSHWDRYLAEQEKRLLELVAADPALRSVDATPRFMRDGTFDACEEFLLHDGTDLLITATHGRTGWKRVFLGSFAEHLIRHAPCPVLVHRKSPRADTADEFDPRRVLVATDFSDGNRPAIRLAREWISTFGSRGRLFHVIPHDPGLAGYVEDAFAGWLKFKKKEELRCHGKMEEILKDEWSGLDAQLTIGCGSPPLEILEEAGRFDADLVVVGTHGRTGWSQALLGSVAERVVHGAKSPVLVVRSQTRTVKLPELVVEPALE